MMNKFVFTRFVGIVVILSMGWLSLSPTARAKTGPVLQPQSENGLIVSAAVYITPSQDAVFDRTRNQLYVSRPDDFGSWDAIISLAVPTNTFSSFVSTRGAFGQMALSDDAHYLYVGQSPATGVKRINLISQTVDLQFPITPTAEFGCTSNEIFDLAVVPDNPDVVVVTKGPLPNQGLCVRQRDPVEVFDNGVPRPSVIPLEMSSRRILFHGTPPALYGDGYTGTGIKIMQVISSGIQMVEQHFSTNPSLLNPLGEFIAAGNRLFRSDGEAVDLTTFTLVHVTDPANAIAVNSNQSRVYYLTVKNVPDVYPATNIYSISSFDAVTLNQGQTFSAQVTEGSPGEDITSPQLFVVNEDQFIVRTNRQVIMLKIVQKEDPVGNAGPDATISASTTLSLQGSGRVDPTSSSLAYRWQQTVGPHAIVSDPTIATPTITAPKQNGVLEFGLRVTDAFGQVSVTDTVRITVTHGIYESYLPILHKADPVYLRVGTYPFTNHCAATFPFIDLRIDMCVTGVEVDPHGFMKFTVSWTLVTMPAGATSVYKNSDAFNPNMNIFDNLGTTHHHFAVGDAAYGVTFYNVGETASGWFLFPPTQQREAFTFTFHDGNHLVTIPNITLPQSGE